MSTPARDPLPIRECPHEVRAIKAILAIGGPLTDEPHSLGVCVDSSGDLVLIRARPAASASLSSFVAGLLSPEARLVRTSTELYVRGLPAPHEPDPWAARVAEERNEYRARQARGERGGGGVLPERPPHDPNDRPDAPPEAVGA